jgi:hypothetical protein
MQWPEPAHFKSPHLPNFGTAFFPGWDIFRHDQWQLLCSPKLENSRSDHVIKRYTIKIRVYQSLSTDEMILAFSPWHHRTGKFRGNVDHIPG